VAGKPQPWRWTIDTISQHFDMRIVTFASRDFEARLRASNRLARRLRDAGYRAHSNGNGTMWTNARETVIRSTNSTTPKTEGRR